MPISPFLTDEEKRRQAVLAETGMTPAEYGDSPDYHAAVAAASPAPTPEPETATPVAGGPTETDFAPKAVKPDSAPAQMEFEPLDVSGKAPPAPGMTYPAMDLTPKTTALDGPIPEVTDPPPAAQPAATPPAATSAPTKPTDLTPQMVEWLKKQDAEKADQAKAAQLLQYPPQLLAALGVNGGLPEPMSKDDKIRRDLYYTFANKDLPESAFTDVPKGGSNALGSILKAQEAAASLKQRQLEWASKDGREQTKFLQSQPGGADATGIDAYLIATKPEEILKMGGVGPLKAMSYDAKMKLAGLINTDTAQKETAKKDEANIELTKAKQEEQKQQWRLQFLAQQQEMGRRQSKWTATEINKAAKESSKYATSVNALQALNEAAGVENPEDAVTVVSTNADGTTKEDNGILDWHKVLLDKAPGVAGHLLPKQEVAVRTAFNWLKAADRHALFGGALTEPEMKEADKLFGDAATYTPYQMAQAIKLIKGTVYRNLAMAQEPIAEASPDDFDRWRVVSGDTTYMNPVFNSIRPAAANAHDPKRAIQNVPMSLPVNGGQQQPLQPQFSEDDSGDDAGGSDAPSEPTSTVVKNPNVQALQGQRVVPNDGAPVGKNPTLPASPTAYRAQHPSQPPPATNRSGAASKSSQKIRVSNGKESFLIDPADEVHAAAEGFKRVK